MALFGTKRAKCDACGGEIEGAGQHDREMSFCSRACLEQKLQLAVRPTLPELTGPRPLTLAAAGLEVAIAKTELDEYKHAAAELHGRHDCEREFMEAQQSYFGVWEHLELVRGFLAARGVATAAYDRERAASLANMDEYEIVTERRFGGGLDEVGTARFVRDNFVRARRSLELLRGLLATVTD